jgi:leader peptidase (prepilin peptidase)/N-methyltransferase
VACTIVFGLALAGLLAAISYVDLRRLIIPNGLNVTLASLGFAYQTCRGGADIWNLLLSPLMMFGCLWLVRELYKASTGRIGLGLGDVKMAAAAATWISPTNLPVMVFVGSATALIAVGASLALGCGQPWRVRLPFGPFLAIGLFAIWTAEQMSFSKLVW